MTIRKAVASVAALAAISATATAQQATLEEIIVTATKRAENLQDIPITVNALSANTIQEAGINNLEDVATLVPSLTVETNLNPFTTAIRIRGFGTSQVDPSLEASVAFILDGIYMGSSGLGMSELTDIERIEVLQGPQGTLFGKNSNAGAISVITRAPNTENTEGFIEVSAGDYSMQKLVGSVSGPLTDTLAYSLAGSWNKYDGWLESNTGDDLNGADDWNVRAKLLWEPTDTLSIQLTGSHVDRDTSCCAADATQTSAVTDQLVLKGLPVPKNDAFDYKNNVDIDSNFDMEADAINMTLDYELTNATFTSLTSWNDYEYRNSYDVERSDLAVLGVDDQVQTGELWSQEFRLTGEFSQAWQYMGGVFYANEERTRGDGSDVAVIGEDIIAVAGAATGAGPVFGLLAQPGDTVSFEDLWETETYAIFGQTSYQFSEAWLATIGLRYTDETKDADLNTQPFSTAALFGTGGSFVELAFAAVDDTFNLQSDAWTGLANISYFVDSQDIMLFASVSTGAKSGGFNGSASEESDTRYDDEETINYELGLKSQLFDNTLQLNVSAFFTEFDDLQFLTAQSSGVGFIVTNAAKATSSGIDMSFSATPWEFLLLGGGLQYLDAKYTEGTLEESGFEVPNAPEWTGNLSATFFLPLGDGVTYLRGDYSFMTDHFTNPTYQLPETEQDRTTVNARLGWRNDNWDAALWIKNATDDSYSSAAAAPLVFSGTETQFLTAPRTFGATLRYSFGE